LIASRSCSIALSTLKAQPYLLVKGDSVFAQITSVNVYGDSVQVVTGSGAIIRDVPDAPINLANDPTTTTDTVIRFTYSEGASNGGTTVISYTIFYDQGSNKFVKLASGVTDLFYLTTITLTAGKTYVFKVRAVNSVGSSVDSSSLSILAAKRPGNPVSLANVPAQTTATQIGLSWSEGTYNGGSPVIDYEVSISTTTSFTVFSTVTTRSAIVTGLTAGTSYKFYIKARNIIGQSIPSSEVIILAA